MLHRFRFLTLLALAAALITLGILSSGSAVNAAGPPDGNGLDHAIAVQDRHTDALLARAGVVGTGVGLGADGQPVIVIYAQPAGVAGLPSSLEGVPANVVVTDMIVALTDPKVRQPRPVPIGVSTGHPDITAGTIGARVVDDNNTPANLTDDVVYALSNNHVFADINEADPGDSALQPGPFDGGEDPADKIGELSDFQPILFDGSDNSIDAAIAISSTDQLGSSTPTDDGYGTPNSTVISCNATCSNLLVPVQKYGRTTGLTTGAVSTVNVTVNVCYKSKGPFRCDRNFIARFVDQIAITPGGFSAGGDSGSLIVTNDVNTNPVGLLFAGSSTTTFANRIDLVLNRFAERGFNVAIDDGVAEAAVPGITVSPTSGLVTTEATGQDTFTVVLDTLPSANVVIALSSSDTTEGTVLPSSLTFTSANGTTPQTVTVTGVDDAELDGDIAYTIVTAPATSTDLDYTGVNPPDVSVTNTDDEVAAGTGTIQGRVKNANTGQKISGATVKVEPVGPSTTTNNGGKYSIADVPAGTQDITVSATGCTPQTVTVEVVANDSVKLEFELAC